MVMSATCAWSATEALLKASLSTAEDGMLRQWAQGWKHAFAGPHCSPRLHVITDKLLLRRAEVMLVTEAALPNVSIRANNFTEPILTARHPTTHNAVFYMISWNLMWADNFTVAPHVLFFDVDAVPILPLRCHHLFDSRERVLWRTMLWHHPAPWVLPDSDVFFTAYARGERYRSNLTELSRGAKAVETIRQWESAVPRLLHPEPCLAQPFGRHGRQPCARHVPYLDMMAHFPIVVPRDVLPEVRRLVTAATGTTDFDAAYVSVGWPCHGDLIGKTMALQYPERISVMHCPSSSRAHEESGTDNHSCINWINPVEHVRHPIQNCEMGTAKCGYKDKGSAASYARLLLAAAKRFVAGQADLPPNALFQYSSAASSLTPEMKRAVAQTTLREDAPGRVCGVG
jgi:hypothetical protein